MNGNGHQFMTNKYKEKLIEKTNNGWIVYTHKDKKPCDNIHKAILYLRGD